METYGNWGQEAKQTFSRLASRLATDSSQPKSKVIAELYGRLNLTLMRAIARAILVRAFRPIGFLLKYIELFIDADGNVDFAGYIYITYTNIRAYKQNSRHFCLLSRTDRWQSLVGSIRLDGMRILSHEDT